MRIYYIGAHGSGKSTLARYTAKKYKLPFLNEVARTVLAEKELSIDTLRTDLDVVDDYQREIFLRQLSEEKRYNEFVSDRSFDNLAYCAQHSRILSKLIYSEELNNYISEIKRDKNTVIFFIRPSKATLKQDGTRETIDWDGVIAIDAMVKFLVEMFEINCININTSSMQERARLVDCVITRMVNREAK